MNSAYLSGLAFALYIAASICFGAVFLVDAPSATSDSKSPTVARYGRPLLLLGILVQFLAIGAYCVTGRVSPFASPYGLLSVFAWTIALAAAITDARLRLPALDAVAAGMACLVLFVAVLRAGPAVGAVSLVRGQLVSLHVLAILASFALLSLACGCAILYVIKNRLLKERRASQSLRLPPLDTLDRVAYHSVAFAFPLLSIGLALGIARVLAGNLPGTKSAWMLDAHTIASFFTWLLYVCYLAARSIAGWRGLRLQYVLIAGLCVALTLYMVPSHMHRFGS